MRYRSILRRDDGSVLAFSSVTVYRYNPNTGDKTLATLTNSDDEGIRNPLTTLSNGSYEVNTDPGVYLLEYVIDGTTCEKVVTLGISAGQWGGGGRETDDFGLDDDAGTQVFAIHNGPDDDTIVLSGENVSFHSDGADSGTGVLFVKQAAVNPTSAAADTAILFYDGTDFRLRDSQGSVAPAGTKEEIAWYDEYHPDKPTNGNVMSAYTDEFVDGADAEWREAGYGDGSPTTTATEEYDQLRLSLTGTGGGDENFYTYLRDTPPGTDDFTVAACLSAKLDTTVDLAGGLCVIMSGTEASPTRLEMFTIERTASFQYSIVHSRSSDWDWASRTEIASDVFFDTVIASSLRTENSIDLYLSLQFDKNDGLYPYYSIDGFNWRQLGGGVAMSAPPISAGALVVNDDNTTTTDLRLKWYRALSGLTTEVGQ